MTKKEIEALKKECSERLHSVGIDDLADVAMLYLQYGLFVNEADKKIGSLDSDIIRSILYNATHGWVKYLNDEIGRPVVFDFDLWADSMNFSKALLDNIHEDITSFTPLMEVCQGVFVAMFRIWYEEITSQNIIDFFDGRPCPELPDMSDMRKTFLWAMDNGIPCHDMNSYLKYRDELLENRTADEEKNDYLNMAKLRDVFDASEEEFVEIGIPKEYLDENRIELRKVFFSAVSFYEMLPPFSDIDELIEEEPEKMQRYFEKFIGINRFPGIDTKNPDGMDEDVRFYYYIIFAFGLQTGAEIYEMESIMGMSDKNIFKEAVENQMGREE